MKWLKEYDSNGNETSGRTNLECYTKIFVLTPGTEFQVGLTGRLSPSTISDPFVSPKYSTREEAVAEMERLLLYG